MNKNIIAGTALTGLVLAGAIAGTVSAQSTAAATGLTEEQVIEIALAQVPGEVIEVELETEDGQQIFEVEILGLDGVEMEVEIDANTGDVLEVEADGEGCDKRGDKDDDDDGEDA